MLRVEHQRALQREVGHAVAAPVAHGLLIAAHVLIQQQHGGGVGILERLEAHLEVALLDGPLEHLLQLARHVGVDGGVLVAQRVGNVGVDAGEMHVLDLALDELHEADVDGRAHDHDLDAVLLVQAHGVGLTVLVGGVVDLVGMDVLGLFEVLVQRDELALAGLVDEAVLHAVVELAVPQAAVLDEGMDVLPVALVLAALVLEQPGETVGDLAGDVLGQLAHVAVVLQEGARDVQRQVGAVHHALEQQQELGDDLLDIVRDEHLVGVELDLALVGGKVVLEPREVQDAVQVEGIVGVEMDPEQRLLPLVEGVAVELLVLLLGAVLGGLEVERAGGVEHLGELLLGLLVVVVLVVVALLALAAVLVVMVVVVTALAVLVVLRLLLCGLLGGLLLGLHLAEDGHGHEGAVLADDLAHLVAVEELVGLVVEVEGDGGADLLALALLHGVLHGAVGLPRHGRRAGQAAERVDAHLLGHHERRVEAQAEVADDLLAGVLVLLQEVARAGERHLVDVLAHLVGGHAHAVVGEGEDAVLLVHHHVDGGCVVLGDLAHHAALGHRVAAVGDQLTHKNVAVGIQPLLDDGQKVFGMYGKLSFFGAHVLVTSVVAII